jgi:tetratricopeptide (TPR) repeat protein
MKRSWIAGSILAIVFCGAVPCWAQVLRPPTTDQPTSPPPPPPNVHTYSIRGTLRLSDTNQPAGVVKLNLVFYNGENATSGFTQSNGEFDFEDLKPGSYNLTAEVEGYEPVRERIDVRGSSKDGLTIYLRKPAQARSGPLSPTVSAHFLALPPKAQEAYEKGIQRLYEKKDLAGSMELFQRAIREAADCYEAYREVGVIHAHLKEYDEAEKAFRKSMELSHESFGQANVGLAEVLSNTGRYAEAEPVAGKAVELHPDMWEAQMEMARAEMGLGKWDAAEKNALAARKINASQAPLHLILANIHIHKADYQSAAEDLETYLRLQPDGPVSEKARSTLEEVRKTLASQKTPPQSTH